MNISYIASIGILLFICSCKPSNTPIVNTIQKKCYSMSNDSLEQSLEFFSLDDSTAQFTLRVENKYSDTLDSYMSNAVSADHIHFIHNRKNCFIAFELTGVKKDSIFLTKCDCKELTVSHLNVAMARDTSHLIVYR